jgi:hypothetical protein
MEKSLIFQLSLNASARKSCPVGSRPSFVPSPFLRMLPNIAEKFIVDKYCKGGYNGKVFEQTTFPMELDSLRKWGYHLSRRCEKCQFVPKINLQKAGETADEPIGKWRLPHW